MAPFWEWDILDKRESRVKEIDSNEIHLRESEDERGPSKMGGIDAM
jgi:hypothetical protein